MNKDLQDCLDNWKNSVDEYGSTKSYTSESTRAFLSGQYFITMKKELNGIVNSITDIVKLKENDLWVDIACNDGTLLSYVPKNLIRVRIDTVDDSYKVESEKHSNLII